MAKVTIREWYERVEALWVPHMPLPALTAEEAIRAARKLYRFIYGHKFPYSIRVTSGNRYTRMRAVNPDRGWHGLVHSLSHNFDPNRKPHSGGHARLEIRMIKEVIKRGWLSGSLKQPEKPKPEKRDERAAKFLRVEAAIERWEAKLRRAQNALKKLERQRKYYARTQAQPSATLQ
jgi:hypothetical protein